MLEKFFHVFAVIKIGLLKKIIFTCSVIFLTPGCKQDTSNEKLTSEDSSKKIFFDLLVGEVPLKVEVAVLPKERERGLMFRDSIGDYEGMLFIFKEGSKQRFWMKNTRIPLDIGYFSTKGSLVEIHKAKPYDLSGVPSKSRDIQFVLELNLGAYKKLGIKIGDRIDLGLISEIIENRDLNPVDYNLP